MKRLLGVAGLVLAGIGLAACLAGIAATWVARPTVLQTTSELLDAADSALNFVEEKTTRAGPIVKTIRTKMDPISAKILHLADKPNRTPEEEKELSRIEEELTEKLNQVDALAEIAETSVALVTKSRRVTKSLKRFSKSADESPQEDSQDNLDSLARLAVKLKLLRETIAKLRDDKQARKETVDLLVGVTREVDENFKLADDGLKRLNERATLARTEVTELRTTIPLWTNWAAVIGSVVLAWLGLGQFVLLQHMWTWIRPNQSAGR
jgi:DNA-binding ferritin-like protein